MYLIKFPEVEGDVNIGKYVKCFKVSSIDYESGRSTVQAPLGSSSRKFGKINYTPMRIVKEVCKASCGIQINCNYSKASECKIYVLDNENTAYIELTLKDALFSNYKFMAHGEIPHEAFDITYTAIETRYFPRNEKGIPVGSPVSNSFSLMTYK